MCKLTKKILIFAENKTKQTLIKTMLTQIINGKIFTPHGWINGGSIVIEDSKIRDILNSNTPVEGVEKTIDAKGGYVLPGAIDLHVHGGGGRDFMETTEDAFLEAIDAHRRHGTTAIAPTLSSSTNKMIDDAAETCDRLMADPMNGIIGLHLEGPYFNPKKAGAQMPEIIRPINPDEYKDLVERHPSIRRWDAAPELDGSEEFARYLRSKGVVVSLAHTAATPEDVDRANNSGFSHATHFYNAMTQYHKEGMYSKAGTVEGVYDHPEMTVEVIGDGIHVPVESMRLAHRVKGTDKMALITDALAVAASDSTKAFDERVKIENGVCVLSDGSAIAGSIATMDRVIKVAVTKAGFPIEEVARMAAEVPAKIMGVYDRKGSLERGKDADIIIMDKDINLTGVVQMGREIEVAKA